MQLVKKQTFGDMTAFWYESNGKIAFAMVPAGMEKQMKPHREFLDADTPALRGFVKALNMKIPAYDVGNAIQFKIAGDAWQNGFSAGCSMLNSESVKLLRNYELLPLEDGVKLVMSDERGLELVQTVRHSDGDSYVRIATSVTNRGTAPVDLEYLASFSLGMLSPFQADDGCEAYEVLRWRSNWSNEGRLEQRPAEELGLEMSWSGYGLRSLRFGEQGSMPVREFFPQAGLIDRKAGVVWGAALDIFGSWEMEISRNRDFFCLSGGLVDREFGQWKKTLRPGETLHAPAAAVTCAAGGAEALQNRLTRFGEGAVPASEEDLPILFNDWCTTWGKPYLENLLPVAERLQNRGIRYFVLDAGWFGKGLGGVGDWEPSPEKYPGGFRNFMDLLREKGFIPGIWFEFEVATGNSVFYREHPEMLLHLDGRILRSGERAFLDFRNPAVTAHLTDKVIRFLKENGIGYMKVDYNAPTGFGCDGAESPSEALRQHMECVEAFFRTIRRELPDLVLEICSSGGHRLSPAWMRLASMGSFSDAHEGVEIPLIAANTAGLIPMRNNQIWAVLHAEDDENRFCYLLSSAFFGRLCISGDIIHLTEQQLRWMDRACELYRKAVPVLKRGENHLIRRTGLSYTHPSGSQIFTRTGDGRMLVIVHTFADTPENLSLPLGGEWSLEDSFAPSGVSFRAGTSLDVGHLSDFQGMVFLLSHIL